MEKAHKNVIFFFSSKHVDFLTHTLSMTKFRTCRKLKHMLMEKPMWLNAILNDKILDWSILNVFAVNKVNVTQNSKEI